MVPLRALDKFRINFPKIPRPRALLTGPACAGSQNSLSTFHKGSQYKPHRGQVKDSPNPHLQGQGQGAYRYIDSDVSPSVVWSPRHGETCLFPVFLDSFLEKFEELFANTQILPGKFGLICFYPSPLNLGAQLQLYQVHRVRHNRAGEVLQ